MATINIDSVSALSPNSSSIDLERELTEAHSKLSTGQKPKKDWKKRLVNHVGDIFNSRVLYGEDKPLFCDDCDQSFHRRLDYHRHVFFKHVHDLRKHLEGLKLDSVLPIRSRLPSTTTNESRSLSQSRFFGRRPRPTHNQLTPTSIPMTDLTGIDVAHHWLPPLPAHTSDVWPSILMEPSSQDAIPEQRCQLEQTVSIEGVLDPRKSPRRPSKSPERRSGTRSSTPELGEQLVLKETPFVPTLEQPQAELADPVTIGSAKQLLVEKDPLPVARITSSRRDRLHTIDYSHTVGVVGGSTVSSPRNDATDNIRYSERFTSPLRSDYSDDENPPPLRTEDVLFSAGVWMDDPPRRGQLQPAYGHNGLSNAHSVGIDDLPLPSRRQDCQSSSRLHRSRGDDGELSWSDERASRRRSRERHTTHSHTPQQRYSYPQRPEYHERHEYVERRDRRRRRDREHNARQDAPRPRHDHLSHDHATHTRKACTDIGGKTDCQELQHDTDCSTHRNEQQTSGTTSSSGEYFSNKSPCSSNRQVSNQEVRSSQEADPLGEHIEVANSRRHGEQKDPTVIPCPVYADTFPCCGKNKTMADLARVLRTKSHNKQYCHPCKELFPTAASYEAHRESCSDHCVVPSCPNSSQGLRHEHNKLTCEKTQSVRKNADYRHLCSLLLVPCRDLEESIEQSHHGQRRKHISARNRRLTTDAEQDNIDLRGQLASCKQQVMNLERDLGQEREQHRQSEEALIGVQKENKELLLLIKYALHEMNTAGVVIPDILREHVELHAPVALDSRVEGARHGTMIGSEQGHPLYTSSSSYCGQSGEYQPGSTSAADITSSPCYHAPNEHKRKKISTSESAIQDLVIPPATRPTPINTPNIMSRHGKDDTKRRTDRGYFRPNLDSSRRSHTKRQRKTPIIQEFPMTNASEQFLDPNPVTRDRSVQTSRSVTPGEFPRNICPGQTMDLPSLPQTPWQSGQHQQTSQLLQYQSVPSIEKDIQPLNHPVSNTTSSDFPANETNALQLVVPTFDHGSKASQANHGSPVLQDELGVSSIQMSTETTGMQDTESWTFSPLTTKDQAGDELFSFDDAVFTMSDWSDLPPTVQDIGPA